MTDPVLSSPAVPRRVLPWLVLAASLLAGACAPSSPPLRIGTNLWPGYEPLHLSHTLGYDGGAPVRLIDFSSASEVVRAYRDGLLDVAAVTADEALLADDGAAPNRVVLVCDTSNGADVILAGPDVATMQDLRGRRIGVETTVLGAFVLARALELNHMTAADVTVVAVPLPEHEEAFVSHRVDAIVTFEPYRTRLIAGGAQVVFDSRAIPGEIADVLVTRASLAPEHERALGDVITGWFRAQALVATDPQRAAAHMAPRLGLSVPAVLDSLGLVQFPDLRENQRLLGGPEPAMRAPLEALKARMVEQGLAGPAVRLPQLDASLVARATS